MWQLQSLALESRTTSQRGKGSRVVRIGPINGKQNRGPELNLSQQVFKLGSQKGQGLVEAILLMAFIGSLSILVVSRLQSAQFLQNIVTRPWAMLAGMVECGVWEPCGPGKHPGNRNRNLSLDPRGG